MRKRSWVVFLGIGLGLIALHWGSKLLQAVPISSQSDVEQVAWVVTAEEFRGKSDYRFNEGTLRITDSKKSQLIALSGESASITSNDSSVPFSKGQVSKLLVETTDDRAEWGGGGPRKAIGQITMSGDLEILVARSAAREFPADFSAASKNDAIRWLLSPSK